MLMYLHRSKAETRVKACTTFWHFCQAHPPWSALCILSSGCLGFTILSLPPTLVYTPFPRVNRQVPRLLSVWHANTRKSRALFFPGLSAGFRQSPAHENNFAHVQDTGCYSRDRTLNRDRLLASESWLSASFGKELLCVDDRHTLPF